MHYCIRMYDGKGNSRGIFWLVPGPRSLRWLQVRTKKVQHMARCYGSAYTYKVERVNKYRS